MADRIKIKITDPDHLMSMGRWGGLADAIARLQKVSATDKLPGFGYALAKLETLEAKTRAENAGANIRLAIKSGYDISVHNVFWGGEDCIELEPIDDAKPEQV